MPGAVTRSPEAQRKSQSLRTTWVQVRVLSGEPHSRERNGSATVLHTEGVSSSLAESTNLPCPDPVGSVWVF